MKYPKMVVEAIQQCRKEGVSPTGAEIDNRILESLVNQVDEMQNPARRSKTEDRSSPEIEAQALAEHNSVDGTRCGCGSHKLVKISAKCSDMCFIDWYPNPKTGRRKEQSGYVPSVLGLGNDSDYLDFELCIACGQVQDYVEGGGG